MAKKDFTKGMEAGAKPFEEKFKQQANTINRVSDRLEKGMEKVSGVVNEVINELTSIEKKRLYDLNTQYDLINLEDHEKELLLACLYTLSSNGVNESQKSFIRSVQKYLGIKNPQTNIDLSGIENVENLSSQKAMFQTISEFLFLKKEDDSFIEEYDDFFDYFSVSKKDRISLLANVKQIFNATGTTGLCEKYGFVAEEDIKAFKEDIIKTEKLQIRNEINISEGEEKKFFGQEIRLSADISCEGKLIFDHCILIYNGDNIAGKINLSEEGSIEISHCTVVGKNNETPAEHPDEYFICGYSGNIVIENTLFYDCRYFANTGAVIDIQNCKIRYPKFQYRFPFLKLNSEKSHEKSRMQNCIIENLDSNPVKLAKSDSSHFGFFLGFLGKDHIIAHYLFSGMMNIISCSFKNILGLFDSGFFGNSGNLNLVGSLFSQCAEISKVSVAKIVYCLFEDCENIFGEGLGMGKLDLKYSQFIDCKNKIVGNSSSAEIEYCDFYNYRSEKSKDDISVPACFHFMDFTDDGRKKISHCLFDGIYLGNGSNFISFSFGKLKHGLIIENCKFLHCIKKDDNELIHQVDRQYGAFGSVKQVQVIDVKNCTGLNDVNKNGQGDKAVDISIKHEMPTGEPIGANNSELIAGLSGLDVEKI
jgi:hypothetical protein